MNSGVKQPAFPLRTAKATRTRQAVIAAAQESFLRDGYAGSSIQAIADAAGVSRATVFNAVGSKPVLLRACYDVATVGDDEPVPLPQRPALVAVRDEPDQRRAIALYAGVIANIGERLSGLYEVFRAAAMTDSKIRVHWDNIQNERLRGSRGFVRLLGAKGALRSGLDVDEAGDVVWAYIDASLYHRLVAERGWSTAQFATWLSHSLADYLLPRRRLGR